MNAKFYDTNILIYAYDQDEIEKRVVCKSLIESVFLGKTKGIISNQILGEFFNIVTSQIEKPISKNLANEILSKYVQSENWVKINYDQKTVIKAGLSSEQYNTPFWDSVIAETMKENDITEIVTEDEKDFIKMFGIKVTNPFKSSIK